MPVALLALLSPLKQPKHLPDSIEQVVDFCDDHHKYNNDSRKGNHCSVLAFSRMAEHLIEHRDYNSNPGYSEDQIDIH